MSQIKAFRIKSFKKNVQICSFKNICLSYGERKILDNINLDIYPGEILGLLGPNGVGKSSLFNLLIGLVKPDSGHILINSINVNELPIYLRTRKFKITIKFIVSVSDCFAFQILLGESSFPLILAPG